MNWLAVVVVAFLAVSAVFAVLASRLSLGVQRRRRSGAIAYLASRSSELQDVADKFPAPGRPTKLTRFIFVTVDSTGIRFSSTRGQAAGLIPWAAVVAIKAVDLAEPKALTRKWNIHLTLAMKGGPTDVNLNLQNSGWLGSRPVPGDPGSFLDDEPSIRDALKEIESERSVAK